MIQTTINGELRQLENTRPDETVAEWLRSAGLTGTKIVCGAGTCGACTVLVDGVHDQLSASSSSHRRPPGTDS